MVDMLGSREQAISIAFRSAALIDAAPVIRQRAVSATKAHVGRMGRSVAQSAIQIHGGIGITEDLDVSHHFRRIEVFDLQFGNTEDHVRRYAGLLDWDSWPVPFENAAA